MTVGQANRDRDARCPRCGAALRRRRRHWAHRLLSILYPVHAYECAAACGFAGVRPCASALARRKRQVRRVLVVVVVAVAAGVVVWKYRGELTWRPERPAAGDDGEEVSAGQ